MFYFFKQQVKEFFLGTLRLILDYSDKRNFNFNFKKEFYASKMAAFILYDVSVVQTVSCPEPLYASCNAHQTWSQAKQCSIDNALIREGVGHTPTTPPSPTPLLVGLRIKCHAQHKQKTKDSSANKNHHFIILSPADSVKTIGNISKHWLPI